MAESIANVMVSIVDSQVKNREKSLDNTYNIESKSESKYTRIQLIDDKKESELIESALHLAFEDNKKWNLDKKNQYIQNKICDDTNRKVFRIICNDLNICSFMNVYHYLECGYRGVADFDIVHHIDCDHDMLYQQIKSPVSRWILSSRDCQCLRMRFYIPHYIDTNSNSSYIVMGTLWYPFDDNWKEHILYIEPPQNFIRIGFKFGARIYYKPINSRNDKFTYIGLQHSYRSGGYIPNFIENAFGLNEKNIKYFEDLCKRIPEELKQRKFNINQKVQEPLLYNASKKKNIVEEVEEKEIMSEQHDKIRSWLKDETVNMEQYFGLLIANGFEDFNLIKTLTLDIMEQIGINKIGHRIELMKRINNLEGNINDDDYVEDQEGQQTQYI